MKSFKIDKELWPRKILLALRLIVQDARNRGYETAILNDEEGRCLVASNGRILIRWQYCTSLAPLLAGLRYVEYVGGHFFEYEGKDDFSISQRLDSLREWSMDTDAMPIGMNGVCWGSEMHVRLCIAAARANGTILSPEVMNLACPCAGIPCTVRFVPGRSDRPVIFEGRDLVIAAIGMRE